MVMHMKMDMVNIIPNGQLICAWTNTTRVTQVQRDYQKLDVEAMVRAVLISFNFRCVAPISHRAPSL